MKKELPKTLPSDAELISIADELHNRLHVQARNLLFEYRFSAKDRGLVPVEQVEKLMRLYGYLIAKEIFEDQKKAIASLQTTQPHPSDD